MQIIGLEVVETFTVKHPKARAPLETWVSVVKAAKWTGPSDIKGTFNSVDYLRAKELFCFNIGGNSFRLCAVVSFSAETIIVEHIFTHAEYDRWNKQK